MGNTITVLAGTTKGLFLLHGSEAGDWRVDGPHCDGWPINHAIADPATGTLWAGGGNGWTGAGIFRSEDGGASWHRSKLSDGEIDTWARNDPDFAAMIGVDPSAPPAPYTGRVEAIWSLCHAHGTLWAGGKPGALFRSTDRGTTWEPVESLMQMEGRESWNPGAAGLTLHTITPHPTDPDRLWLAISAAGVFASEDGGASWDRRNRLSNAGGPCSSDPPAAPNGGETGLCVHNLRRAPGDTDLLYQQNHHGTFRSADGGRSWEDITGGLPSTFGFPVAVHPANPGTLWTLPLNGDAAGRYPPGAAAAVWRSRDRGDSWERCRNGLPQTACYFTVLRQAMAVDGGGSPGLYFGTNTGSIFASFDEGDSWSEIAEHLPTVLSVEASRHS